MCKLKKGKTIERFKTMLKGNSYAMLLNHQQNEVIELFKNDNVATYEVTILGSDKNYFPYLKNLIMSLYSSNSLKKVIAGISGSLLLYDLYNQVSKTRPKKLPQK